MSGMVCLVKSGYMIFIWGCIMEVFMEEVVFEMGVILGRMIGGVERRGFLGGRELYRRK